MANDIGAGMNTYLLAQAAVKAIVADRGYPDILPESLKAYPAYAYTVISDIPSHHLTGISGLSQARVQFDCYAETRRESNLLAETIRLAIDSNETTMGGEVVRTCHLENTFRSVDEPNDGSDKWRYITTQDYLVIYVQSTS